MVLHYALVVIEKILDFKILWKIFSGFLVDIINYSIYLHSFDIASVYFISLGNKMNTISERKADSIACSPIPGLLTTNSILFRSAHVLLYQSIASTTGKVPRLIMLSTLFPFISAPTNV